MQEQDQGQDVTGSVRLQETTEVICSNHEVLMNVLPLKLPTSVKLWFQFLTLFLQLACFHHPLAACLSVFGDSTASVLPFVMLCSW